MTVALVGRSTVTDLATLVLTRSEIARLMSAADWLDAVEIGFRLAAEGKAIAPPPMTIEGKGGAFHAKGASLQLDRLYVALKLNGNFPANPEMRGLPTIQGAILLYDGESGSLLAVLDSIEITLRRTAAATALAARYLARAGAGTLFICGCGAQGRAQLTALREVLVLDRVFAWDLEPSRACAFAEEMGDPSLVVEAVHDLNLARFCDVIVTCTTARKPFLGPDHVGPGAFVAAVGADSPDKSEIEPALMAKAVIVGDLLDQCAAMGDLRHALASEMGVDDVRGEIGDLVTGRKAGRQSPDEIMVFDSTGTALQDVASAAHIFARTAQIPGLPTIMLGA